MGGVRALLRGLRGALAGRSTRRLAPREAYRLWSETYDHEPDNVVLAVEQQLFAAMVSGTSLDGKVVVDIGCGTGRHWGLIRSRAPRVLHGVDTSPEMLARLRARFPDAVLHLRAAQSLDELFDGTVDVVTSSLMLGHASGVADELREWARALKVGGDIVLTDFHPDAIRRGMRATFTHRGTTFEIEHEAYSLEALSSLFRSIDLEVLRFEERRLDEASRPSFARQNYLPAYRRFYGTPLVLGYHLRKVGRPR